MKPSWPCDDMEILASCDQGILICKGQICRNKQFYACKPATNQWEPLPNPKLRYKTISVAVVVVQSQPLRYIIARLHSQGSQHQCHIFDSEIWRWEKIDCPLPYEEIIINSVTTSSRFVHWLTSNDKVLTLDVEKRCFKRSSLPKIVSSEAECYWKSLVE